METVNELYHGDVFDAYEDWEAPTVIVSDGAYGVNGFEDDPRTADGLADWYEPHVKKWTEAATPETTLWFWNTELGWANVHPILEKHGWTYRGANIWNKGLQHIAGNCNTETMRKFPQVTEVCVHYVLEEIRISEEGKHLREWLREEWQRTGLPMDAANEACGVADAASRKYFAKDDQWYPPPPEKFKQLREYANEHGDPEGRPYFMWPEELEGIDRDSVKVPSAKFDLPVGVTNVWDEPPVSRSERQWDDKGGATHPNQKPIELMERIVRTSSEPGDLVWEPFGGLCTGSIAAARLGRDSAAAELQEDYYEIARERLSKAGESGGQSRIDQFGK